MRAEALAIIGEMALFAALLIAMKVALRWQYKEVVYLALKVLAVAYGITAVLIVLLRFVNPPFTALQLQRYGESVLARRAAISNAQFVPLPEISIDAIHAAIVAEDPNFYSHNGIDWWQLRYKVAYALRTDAAFVGASTITQQLAKNLFLPNCRSYGRKAAEFAIAPLLEIALSKERILELYLNVIEWGRGTYGIDAAARRYYGASATDITREQAARLVATLPNPLLRNPQQQNATSRSILERMAAVGW